MAARDRATASATPPGPPNTPKQPDEPAASRAEPYPDASGRRNGPLDGAVDLGPPRRCVASPTSSNATMPRPTRSGPSARPPAAIAELPVDELAAMAPARLQAIPGVGKTTAQVIAEAGRPGPPEYLQSWSGGGSRAGQRRRPPAC